MMEIDELAGVEYLKTLTAQIKQINELSKESFELRYEKKKDICSNLGKHGWVVSGNITPTDPREWLHSIELYSEEKIAEYFTESEMGRIIDQITGFLINFLNLTILIGQFRIIYLAAIPNQLCSCLPC